MVSSLIWAPFLIRRNNVSPAKRSSMPDPETFQEPNEAQGNLQVPGFYVGSQSNDIRDL